MHHIKPMVTCQTGKERLGKGFSPDEVRDAGLNPASARKLGIPIDWKRKSVREENITCLKAHADKLPAKTQKSKN
jgi:large subunit ribosomal protein L13e